MSKGSLAIASATVLLLAACREASAPPRSVVLIVIDTLRQDHLAAYGYERETAPALSRLAAEGAVLQGLSPTSWTRPATASLLTGLHPLRHQALNDAEALDGGATTLAESMRAHGYQTVGVSGTPQVSEEVGLGQGFQSFVLQLPRRGGAGPSNAQLLNQRLAAVLPTLRAPFFLYLHYVDPHSPYSPPTAWDGSPLPGRLAARAGLGPEAWDPSHRQARDPQLVRDMVDLYDGEIREADRRIADVLAALDARGLLKGTLTLVTADHGEEFEDHGRLSHGFTLYEEMVRVPLIVHAPDLVARARHGPASLLDVVPTVLGLLGLPVPATDGRDLSAPLRAGRPDGTSRSFLLHLDLREMVGLALREGDRKLILARHPHAQELYDLAADPREAVDRYAASSGEVAALSRRLFAAHNALAASPLPRRLAALSAEQREALAAAGYVGGDIAGTRGIPEHLSPPASDLLAWDDPATLRACLSLASREGERQLRHGWYPPEAQGRWSEPSAALALGWPSAPGDAVLEVRGINYEDRPQSFRLAPGSEGVERVPPGPFTITRPVSRGGDGAPLLVRFRRDPGYVPATRGLADHRTLGVFVTSACLRPVT
jgi:arylsulfatase A-like enzyme